MSSATQPLLSYGSPPAPGILWTPETSGQFEVVTGVATDGATIVATLASTNIITSTDGGVTWVQTN